MDSVQTLLDAGPTPLDDLLDLGLGQQWCVGTQYSLISSLRPEFGMEFLIKKDPTSVSFLYQVSWLRDGSPGRDGTDLPTEVLFSGSDGRPVEKRWRDSAGQLHRDDDKPAVVTARTLQWYRHGQLHRDGGKPAKHVRQLCDVPFRELEWYDDGCLQRHALSWCPEDMPPSSTCRPFTCFRHGMFSRFTWQTAPVAPDTWVGDNAHFASDLDLVVELW
jgi:hypothetical protein